MLLHVRRMQTIKSVVLISQIMPGTGERSRIVEMTKIKINIRVSHSISYGLNPNSGQNKFNLATKCTPLASDASEWFYQNYLRSMVWCRLKIESRIINEENTIKPLRIKSEFLDIILLDNLPKDISPPIWKKIKM